MVIEVIPPYIQAYGQFHQVLLQARIIQKTWVEMLLIDMLVVVWLVPRGDDYSPSPPPTKGEPDKAKRKNRY